MTDYTISTGDSGYTPVNGLQMYYEVHGGGSGRPLVLLHGNLSTIGVDFGGIIPSLAGKPPGHRRGAACTATPPTSTARCPSRTGPATPSPCCATWGSGRPTCSATAPGRRWPCSSPSTTRSWSANWCSPRPATG